MRKILFPLILFAFGQLTAQNWKHNQRTDSIVNAAFRYPAGPGFSVLVIQKGAIVYEKYLGFANIKKQIPISAETRFPVGSVTKQFTATLIYLLQEEGKLKLSDEIHRYLPELPNFGHPITVGHLVSHTSGIRDHAEFLFLSGQGTDKNISYSGLIQVLNNSPVLAFPPGKDFMYSNAGYELLAMIAERATGVTFGLLLKQRIFDPLGMKNSTCMWDDSKALEGKTFSYTGSGKKFKKSSTSYNAMGATGVQCTARDFYLWDQNYRQNRLGKGDQALINEMITSYQEPEGLTMQYGAGLLTQNYRGYPTAEHAGGWNNYLMQYRRFPEQDFSVVVICNNSIYNPFALCDKLCDLVLESPGKNGTLKNSACPIPAEQFTGNYLSAYNLVRRVFSADSLICIAVPYGSKDVVYKLLFQKQISSETVLFTDTTGKPVYFQKKDGKFAVLIWGGGHYFGVNREYYRIEPAQNPDPENAGRYYSADAKRWVRVKYNRRKQRLILKPLFFIRYPLTPVGSGIYALNENGVILRFEKNGMIFGNEWLPGMRLTKKK